MVSDDGLTLRFNAGICDQRYHTTVVETRTEVRVGVDSVHRTAGVLQPCIGDVRLKLDSVLGSRSLIDSLTGRVIQVEPATQVIDE